MLPPTREPRDKDYFAGLLWMQQAGRWFRWSQAELNKLRVQVARLEGENEGLRAAVDKLKTPKGGDR